VGKVKSKGKERATSSKGGEVGMVKSKGKERSGQQKYG
jgi:hypothetical protein